MKKQIILGITIITCVALYTAVWLRSAMDEAIPIAQEKPSLSADMSAMHEEPLHIIFSADAQSPKPMGTEELTSEKEQAPSPPNEAETT